MTDRQTPQKLRAVAFDMDGVLLSTDRLHYQAWQVFTRRHGIPFSETDYAKTLGLSRADSLDVMLSHAPRTYTPEEKRVLSDEKNALYRSLIDTLTPDFVDSSVRACLAELRAAGWNIALASSSRNAPLILERTDLGAFFDATVDGNDISRGKPDPEVYAKAAAALGVPPNECVAVDDAPAGIASAQAAGMTGIAMGEAARLGVAPCSIETLAELPALLERLNAGRA